ncbi:MAG: glutaminyl-peptide cyclotransferase [Sphingomonadales bacterium]|nr:MAG: glutaminyl-peptide cyclotransferase [Sphingomonadales bacterium]
MIAPGVLRASLLLVGAIAASASARLPVSAAAVVKAYPHDPDAFTEGLLFREGKLFESTGLEGRSDIREVRLVDGKVLRRVAIPSTLFGEGIVDAGGEIVSVTWRTGKGFRWSIATFKRTGAFTYAGEGWGMTRLGREIVLSDGTPTLRFLDPVTFRERRRLTVTAEGKPLRNLNELEYVRGEILANIWQTDVIARISPATGQVIGWIDVSGLPRPPAGPNIDAVPNGIAWDAKGSRLFVTGKNWDKLYEVRLEPQAAN